jgi:hypothetical protein
MSLYSRTVDYCANDDVKVLPKYHRDYVPDGVDPITFKPTEKTPALADDEHDLSKRGAKPATKQVERPVVKPKMETKKEEASKPTFEGA